LWVPVKRNPDSGAQREKAGVRKPAPRVSRSLPMKVRIIGGAWKRTLLPVLDRPGLRPTPDRVRETLFNWLGNRLDGWRCLDLYAGSGALGFECASRGAARVVLVERDARIVESLRSVKDRLAAETIELAQADAFAWVSQTAERFDLVLLDPPFGEGVLERIVPRLAGVLAPGAALYVESDAPVDIDNAPWTQLPGVRVHRTDRAGLVHYHLLLMPAEPTGA
jgi:16S rRNA (guanine(966)-N(2))-methyltransferase RsmD